MGHVVRRIYNWQQEDWPDFRYQTDGLHPLFFEYSKNLGNLGGTVNVLEKSDKTETFINTIITEAIKTSAIEGEFLSKADVMSSIKNNLGLHKPLKKVHDKRAEGIAELMLEVRNTFNKRLSFKMLYHWHKLLMKGEDGLAIGGWRTHKEPMQVVSGALGKQKIHFEAPPSADVPGHMKAFVKWFNDTAPGKPGSIEFPLVRAGLAHLYFESIHPFEDGNGRIGRTIAEKALYQYEGQPFLISLSASIEANKQAYYDQLQKAQRTNELTAWLHYFVTMVCNAQTKTLKMVDFTLKKSRFFEKKNALLNNRQTKVIHTMLKAGPEGFEGGMNARKYMSIARTSKATATRDLQDLFGKGIFKAYGGGRSTRYDLVLDIQPIRDL